MIDDREEPGQHGAGQMTDLGQIFPAPAVNTKEIEPFPQKPAFWKYCKRAAAFWFWCLFEAQS